jgi:hypothetical protein
MMNRNSKSASKKLCATLIIALVCSRASVASGAQALTPTPTDTAVLTVVLTQFSQSKESAQYNPHGHIGISPTTTALMPSVTNKDYYEILKAGRVRVPDDALYDYIKRNRQTFQIDAFESLGDSARMESEDLAFTGGLLPNPDLKTFVSLRVPGYSADGNRAYVSFDFRWSIHGASAFYMLQRRAGVWTIVTTDFVFAV